MQKLFVLIGILGSVLVSTSAISGQKSEYIGQEEREVKALSNEKLMGLLEGAGLGYAKTAELNGWPGPRHVMDLKSDLELSADQLDQIEKIYSKMKVTAIALGEQLVEQEIRLEKLFKSQNPSMQEATSILKRIGELEADLRGTHLKAHLRTTPILSKHQRMMYSKLRGYGAGQVGHSHSHN